MKKQLRRFAVCFLTVIMMVCFASFIACVKVPMPDSSSEKQSSESVTDSSTPADSSSSSVEDSSSSTEDSSSSSTEDSSSTPADSSSSSTEEDPEPESEYTVVNGRFSEANGTLRSTATNNLAVHTTGEFSQGTLSAKVTLRGKGGDNGIIFGLKNENNLTTFWENAGIHYYFFFLSNAGTAYLGKVSNQTWTVCSETPIPGFNASGSYLLEVSRDKSNADYDVIRCYVNGTLYVSYKDGVHNDGVGYGVRAGSGDVSFSEVEITSEIKGSASELDGYYIANGSWESSGEQIVSSISNSIAEKKDGEFIYGTLSVTMSPSGNRTDNGIIFGLTSNSIHAYWEQEVSYYFYFLSKDGTAFLGKVDNGTWETCQFIAVPGYSENKTYTLKIERDADCIYGYVNDELYVAYADAFPLEGSGYGLRAGAAGVKYSNLTCSSSGEVGEPLPENLDVLSGKFTGRDGAVKSGTNENIALVKESTFTSGTYSATVRGVSTKRAGLIFAYSNVGDTESYYRFVSRKEAQRVEIDMVVNGVVTNVYSNYLSAGYSAGGGYTYKVVIENGKAYCYFWNTLYTVFDLQLSGDRYGLYAEGPATQFTSYEVSESADIVKVDTLMFGHSYFELWHNYKNDMASLANEFNLGTYTNIGIGGSIASHWNKFKEGLVAYEAKQAIYMIGINDLTGGTSPLAVVTNIESTLLYMKEASPELTVVLLSVNHCPARTNIVSAISETNDLMQELCAQYEWISYAEVEYAFCDNGVNPDAHWFTDGLHPTANGYIQKIVPAIRRALLGEGQPEMSDELKAELLARAKEMKKSALIDYSEWSYRSAEWVSAQPYYDEAIMLIDACERAEEVEALDLSTIIASLKAIKRNTDYVNEELVSGTNDVWETATFTSAFNTSSNGIYNVTHDGHRINTQTEYTDMSFTFCLSDITNEFATVGILFRATQTAGLGINGYMINIVTKENYIQIWHFANGYGSTGGNNKYIGGWVFPGEVENTLFRAIIENDTCYIYTEEDYQSKGKSQYGCSANLNKDGSIYNSGYLGVLCWNSSNGAQGKLAINNISGNVVEKAEVEPEVTDYTSQIITALNASDNLHSLTPANITGNAEGVFSLSGYAFKLYNGVDLANFTMQVKAEANNDVGVSGFMFRCKKNATNDGVDGYLFNYVSNATSQFIQIFYLQNAYNTNNSALICDYIGGWVFPGNVLGTTFDVTVEGSVITVAGGGQSIAISLTGAQIGATYTEYTSGGIGVLSWQDLPSTLTIYSVKA